MSSTATIIHGNCIEEMKNLEAGSINAVICDPPYAEYPREYGHWTEVKWHEDMDPVVSETRRVLKPNGSAVFILQPNSVKAGQMRPWLWEFIAKYAKEWNLIQDVLWWNTCALPVAGSTTQGLCRPAIKYCVWLGSPDCCRNQEAVLWKESQQNAAHRAENRAWHGKRPSGLSVNDKVSRNAAVRRGGVTPFNVLPYGSSGNGSGRGATTPLPLADWWTRYITKPGDTILDPFCGSGTMGIAALKHGRNFIGIEKMEKYAHVAANRIIEKTGIAVEYRETTSKDDDNPLPLAI